MYYDMYMSEMKRDRDLSVEIVETIPDVLG
jgi:hypothetical protein